MFRKKRNQQIESNLNKNQGDKNNNEVQNQTLNRGRDSFPWWLDINHVNPFVAIGILGVCIIIAILTECF